MKEIYVEGNNLPEVYHRTLIEMRSNGELTKCTDWNTNCLESGATLVIKKPLSEPMISKCFIGGPKELQQYIMEMLDGILDFEVLKGNWEYTYHARMVHYKSNLNNNLNQIDFIVDELKRNPDSRRAVVLIRDADECGNNDPACMQHIQFMIRNGFLDINVLFRSNDLCKASFMNMFAMILLQENIAKRLGVEVGTYKHRVNSLHVYQKDFPLLDGYIKRLLNDPDGLTGDTITSYYEDDWQDMMEEYIPDIEKTVEELKAR